VPPPRCEPGDGHTDLPRLAGDAGSDAEEVLYSGAEVACAVRAPPPGSSASFRLQLQVRNGKNLIGLFPQKPVVRGTPTTHFVNSRPFAERREFV
jgi:hypothetical protein